MTTKAMSPAGAAHHFVREGGGGGGGCAGSRYEGTGRSLSLKLLQQLRAEGARLSSGDAKPGAAGGRTFREVQLQEPIRCGAPLPLLLTLLKSKSLCMVKPMVVHPGVPLSGRYSLSALACLGASHMLLSWMLEALVASKHGELAEGCGSRVFKASPAVGDAWPPAACRYGAGDKVEAWLHELLCLNAAEHVPPPPPRAAAPG